MSRNTPSEGVSSKTVIEQLSLSVPISCRENIVVIGSLAAGYHFFGKDEDLLVQTKDIDCLLYPYVEAVDAGIAITEALIGHGWTYAPTAEFPKPGDPSSPDHALPVVRLYPPHHQSWFVELLTAGETKDSFGREFIPLETSLGRFCLCSFGGIRLTQWNPIVTEYGISIARPEMMALSNLLHHKEIGSERMASPFAGRAIKRSNKDLGRVLALAYLAERKSDDALLNWPTEWEKGLRQFFPNRWRGLATNSGSGLRRLLNSKNDFDEAHFTCQHGLVAALGPSAETLRAAGERLLADAVEPIEEIAKTR